MSKDSLFLPDLSPIERHDIHASFDGGSLSSDGGVLLLRELEKKLDFAPAPFPHVSVTGVIKPVPAMLMRR